MPSARLPITRRRSANNNPQAIEAVIVPIASIAAGEFAENEFRKAFTTSERVAILETLKGPRQGPDPEFRPHVAETPNSLPDQA